MKTNRTKQELQAEYESRLTWVSQRLTGGDSVEEISDLLMSQGMSRFEADGLTHEAARLAKKSQRLEDKVTFTLAYRTKRVFSKGDKVAGLVSIGIGFLMILAGIGLTLLTQAIASSGGGSAFLVFWGLIVFGAWIVLKGVWTFLFGR